MNRAELMKRIQEQDFVVLETALYLNAHPDNQAALEHYRQRRAELDKLVDEYESKFGPLTMANAAQERWTWGDAPWPWFLEMNEREDD